MSTAGTLVMLAVVGPTAPETAPAHPTQRSVLSELEQLDKTLAEAEDRVATFDRQSEDLRREIARIETELAVARVQRAEAWDAYVKRVRALARMPVGARLALLGGSHSLEEFLRGQRVLRWVASHDRILQRRLQQHTRRLHHLERALERQRDGIESIVEQARLERDIIASRRQERLTLLEEITEERDLQTLARREKSYARRELASMVRRLQPSRPARDHFAANRGSLPWPTVGTVDIRFGQQLEHAFGSITTHNGVDIRATAGSDVQAIAHGRVAFADWLKGYGQLVIIDHGDAYHSLVAHLGQVLVEVGDEVSQGTVLGRVGDTGSLRGTVLYFEIRHEGTPVDPIPFLRR